MKLDYLRIPFEDIKSATKDFDERKIIGRGGFGTVYKAELDHFDVRKFNRERKLPEPPKIKIKSTVAIKLLDVTSWLAKQQFSTEIQMLCDCWHENVVTLLGFCEEGPQMILVYELAVNGSLDEYLDKTDCKGSLNWVQRLRICLGAARGLEYLHCGLGDNRMIIHCDVKSSNILLDQFFVAKVADFGLSKAGLANQQLTYVPSAPTGTPGYLDPNFLKTHQLTRKSDVFSFGVVLFEVLFGRLAWETKEDEKWFLAKLARLHYKEGRLDEIYDPDLKKAMDKSSSVVSNGIDLDSMNTFSKIAYRCLQENPDQRPTMAQIATELEKALKYQVKGVEVFRISLQEIKFATNNFDKKNIIGRGGQGIVYEGELSCFNVKGGSTVAIKRFDIHSWSGQRDYLFMSEVALLFNYSHKNIIPLLGFCNEEDEKILVYHFAPNRSLDEHLQNKCSLIWTQRLKICIDVAHGLHYLHDGLGAQHRIIHCDVKSSNILLGRDWEATISDFGLSAFTNQTFTFLLSNVGGTFGYVDPLYLETGLLTEESDVFSFGVVLFEILCGRMAIADFNDHRRLLFHLARRHFEEQTLNEIVDQNIMEHINLDSLHIFSKIAYKCIEKRREKRPTMYQVIEELEKALEFQENYEWGPKLPRDHKEIIEMSKPRVVCSTNKALYELLSKGILLDKGKWFSLNKDGKSCEMVSATMFPYQHHKKPKWRAIGKSRFPKVAKMPDLSNLELKVHIQTQFLCQGITYAAYLVFKFFDRKKITTRPVYVELSYKLGKEQNSSIAYFAEWRDSGWMAIDLCHFTVHEETCVDFEVLLVSFSRYYCGSGAIYVEGIEFLPVENVEHEDSEKFNDENNEESLLKSGKLNGKNCHMLPATTVLCDSSNTKRFKRIVLSKSRFQDAIEILSYHEFCIESDIETRMLSPNTAYACYLVYRFSEKCLGLQYPVKTRHLLSGNRQKTIIAYLRSPSPENAPRSTRLPVKRKDRWMEVVIWEFNFEMADDNATLPMHMKLISLGGNMSGLVLAGVEFRPQSSGKKF